MTKNLVYSSENYSIATRDTSKIFIGYNRWDSASFTNDTGADVTLQAGTIISRKNADGSVLPYQSDADAGNKVIVGILGTDTVVPNTSTVPLHYCVAGDVVKNKLVFFKDGDDLNSLAENELVKDAIRRVGIKLINSVDNTRFDNY